MKILSPLELRTIPNEAHYWVLISPLIFSHKFTGTRQVPIGTKTDLASIPRIFQRLFQVNDLHREEAVVHDWLYYQQGELEGLALTRKQCDQIFLDGLKSSNIGWLKRKLMYRAVRIGGFRGWKHGN